MKSLFDYIQENEGGAFSTPSNTMGMGNPGVLPDGNLTEPITTAKCKKEKPKKKKVSESILDDEDVLIDDVKKSVNDPIVSLYHIFLKNKTLKNNREVNNIILELSKIFKLGESRIEISEYDGRCEIHFNNPKKYIKRFGGVGGDIPGPRSTLLSISLRPEINGYALQKCNLKTKKSIAAIDNFIETHNLTIGNGTRYFNSQMYYKKF